MSEHFGESGGEYRYPFLLDVGWVGGGDESCGCKYSCHPQFHVEWEAVHNTREKVGFTEFVVSDPPRYFLLKHTTFRHYAAGDFASSDYWEYSEVDAETGDGTFTASDPAFPGFPVMSQTPVITTTATTRRTVWTQYNGDEVEARLVQLEVLSREMTTEHLQNLTIDELPAWSEPGDFPGANLPGFPGTAHFVQSGICYQSGDYLWDSGARYQVPNVWRLAADESEFVIQRVRYKIIAPHIVGATSFRIEWKERFIPDGDDPQDPVNPQTFDGSAATPKSDIFAITERPDENGENFICCARFVPAA